MSKRKADVLSYQEDGENMIAWVDGDETEDEFDMQTNNIEVSPLSEDEDSGKESSVEDQELVEEEPQRFRKTITKNRLAHSINSSLDMRNYNPIVYLNSEGNFTKKNIWDSEAPAVGGGKDRVM